MPFFAPPNEVAVPLEPTYMAPRKYFVGPGKDGPAVVVHITGNEKAMVFSQGLHSISGYKRPPYEGEDYGTWAYEANADDIGNRHVEERIRQERMTSGAHVVKHSLVIEPPLKEQPDIQAVAEIVGRQLLASREDPKAPFEIINDLTAAGIPFDSAEVRTQVLSARKAQDDPTF